MPKLQGDCRPLPHALRSGGGCTYCARPGFDRELPSLVYLLIHEQLHAYKFGITNVAAPTNRIKHFNRRGWQLLRAWPLTDGATARDAESRIKHELRVVLQLPPYLSKTELADGWTETVGDCSLSGWELSDLANRAVMAARLAGVEAGPCADSSRERLAAPTTSPGSRGTS